jgi:flavin-dependent dehydrogenase
MAAALHRALEARVTMWDAVVVGAGPAGSLAARQLAREGASVLLLDRQRFPRWKVCGACLAPGALRLLDLVGLGGTVTRAGAIPLEWLALEADDRRARLALRGTMALSRTAFDGALVDAAVSEGVDFRDGARVDPGGLIEEAAHLELRIEGESVRERARVVVDATGIGVGLAPRRGVAEGLVGGEPPRAVVAPGSRLGVGATLDDQECDVPFGELRMVVGRSGYVGLVRVEGGLLNVAAAIDPEALSDASPAEAVHRILAESGSSPVSGVTVHGWKGTQLLTRRPRAVARTRLFRLGDAAGYVEPFTGEGMAWAMASATAVVPFAREGIRAWRDELIPMWTAEHGRRVGRSQRLCRRLVRGLRRPGLVRTAVGILGRAPILAEPFVRATARAPHAAARARV